MSAGGPTLYELLEVEETAGEHEITLAFRRVAKRWHPDLNSTLDATERMQHISAAYDVLRDPERRADYDRGLHSVQPACRGDADVDAEGAAAFERSAWGPAMTDSAPIADSGPPPGFRTPPHPLSLRRGCASRPGHGDQRHGTEAITRGSKARLVAVACMMLCPAVLFLLAAARSGDRRFAQWGCAYALAPLLCALATASGTAIALHAGLVLTLVGAIHAAGWRERLAAAVRDGRPEARG